MVKATHKKGIDKFDAFFYGEYFGSFAAKGLVGIETFF